MAALFLCALAACSGKPEERPAYFKPAAFSDLPGWASDRVGDALLPLARSCGKRLARADDEVVGPGGVAGLASDWKPVCREAIGLLFSPDAARDFFERNFVPYEVRSGRFEDEGLFTGYYEASLKGAREKKTGFETPLLRVPDELVVADLGLFLPEFSGRKITGMASNGKLTPAPARADIVSGALGDRNLEMVFVSDPVDAFFLQVQGSGRIDLDDGSVMQVGYAAQNGRGYVAIGKELIARGALTRDNVSMQSIRRWLHDHPQEAAEVMNLNPSYVFFRELGNAGGPLGAENVPLSPGRSLAVDSKKMPYGVPVFLDAQTPDQASGQRLQKLLVAQDTGGAIKGAVRGDVFWGFGPEAENAAGIMKSRGRFWVLLPKGANIPKEKILGGWF